MDVVTHCSSGTYVRRDYKTCCRSYIRIPLAMWRHSRGTVAALSQHCGGTLVALWRHSHAALSWHCHGTLESRGTVMALSCLPPALLAISRLSSGGFLSTSSSKMKTFKVYLQTCDLE